MMAGRRITDEDPTAFPYDVKKWKIKVSSFVGLSVLAMAASFVGFVSNAMGGFRIAAIACIAQFIVSVTGLLVVHISNRWRLLSQDSIANVMTYVFGAGPIIFGAPLFLHFGFAGLHWYLGSLLWKKGANLYILIVSKKPIRDFWCVLLLITVVDIVVMLVQDLPPLVDHTVGKLFHLTTTLSAYGFCGVVFVNFVRVSAPLLAVFCF